MSVEVRGLRKSFGANEVLRGVNLAMRDVREIHALLGANGAGKSTLVRCLGGVITADSGEIIVDGRHASRLTPRTARAAGIAVIHQHLSLIGSLSVVDNIYLGAELRRGPIVRRSEETAAVQALLDRLGVAVDPRTPVHRLSIAQRQLVEIAKALHGGGLRLLILDEPTAALSDGEARMLASHLRGLRDEGVHILYITHLLQEVFDVADRLTVLRDGEVILCDRVDRVTHSQVVEAIAGGGINRPTRPSRAPTHRDALLAIDDLRGTRFGPLSLSVRRGEIVSVFGGLGAGKTELLETVFGLRRPEAGEIRLKGRPVRTGSPRIALGHGIALVPEDRHRQGLLARLSASDNMLMASFTQLARRGIRARARERQIFEDGATRLRLQPRTPSLPVDRFSGGGQQKLIVGRWLYAARKVEILLLDEPTQGIDVGARQELWDVLRAMVDDGSGAALVASSDPDEAIAVGERILVLRRGTVCAELTAADATPATLLHAAHAETAQ